MDPKHLRYLGAVASVLLFSAALWILHRELSSLRLVDILRELYAISATQMLLAAGLAVASYFLLILYDELALRYVARRLPYSRIALASFRSEEHTSELQ